MGKGGPGIETEGSTPPAGAGMEMNEGRVDPSLLAPKLG